MSDASELRESPSRGSTATPPAYPAPAAVAEAEGDPHAQRSAMTERFNLLFRWFADRFFSHFELDPRVIEELKALEARGSVVYVMRYSSRLDYFLFNTLFLRHGLRLARFANAIQFYYYRPLLAMIRIGLRRVPGRPREVEHCEDCESVRRQVRAGHSLFLFLRTQRLRTFLRRRRRGTRSDELDLVAELVRSVWSDGSAGCATRGGAGAPGGAREVFVVPLAIFWQKGPRSTTRFVNVDYGSLTRPSDFAKVARFVSTYRSLSVKVGDPIDVRRFVEDNRDEGWHRLALKIRRAVLIYLYREEKAVEGPALKPRWRVLREVLADAGVRRAMNDVAKTSHGSLERAERDVDKIFREISADMSSTWLALGAWVAGGLFRRLFASIETHRLAEVAEVAKRNPIVLVPSHRSYFDFLIVSWLFYQNYLVPPHIAARENMAFGPFGFLFRRMGAFFLRRSFDEPLYKEVFRAYVAYLVRGGFTQEFFIEGGRSRTGKTLAPRLGMLTWDVDAFLESRRRDLLFVPIALSYERLVEESGMLEELSGGTKKDESILGLLRARKYLQRRFGSVHVSFGEPISLADALKGRRDELERLVRGELSEDEREAAERHKREFVQQLGHSLVERIGWAMVANATSVAAVVLLGSPHPGMQRARWIAHVQEVARLLELQGVRLTPAFEHDLDQLRDAIAFLERSDLITRHSDPRGEILSFDEKGRRALDLYRNAVAHFLVIPSILARALLAGRERDRLEAELETWLEVLYREYFVSRSLYLSRGEAVVDYFERQGWIQRSGDRWIATERGREILGILAEQTRGVIECYEVVVRTLLEREGSMLRRELRAEARARFDNARRLGEVRRPEAATDVTFDNAIAWLAAHDVIRIERVASGKRGAREQRYAPGDRFERIGALRTLLARALVDG